MGTVRNLPDNSIDSVVTDPPYALVSIVKRFGTTAMADATDTSDRARKGADGYARLSKGFMGKQWDNGAVAFAVEFWSEVFRVLKPGGHVAAFGGTRTYHRLVCAIEDAGFEIRDQLAWIYGTGFPKSHDVSKGIDRAAGAARTEVVGSKLGRPGMARDGSNQRSGFGHAFGGESSGTLPTDILAPATAAAAAWEGWGTALKPAWEPICLARKPLSEGTVAANVLRWGTGAINIDGCRVGLTGGDDPRLGGKGDWSSDKMANNVYKGGYAGVRVGSSPLGRWPANITHDGSPEVLSAFPDNLTSGTGAVKKATGEGWQGSAYGKESRAVGSPNVEYGDTGSAARFFYSAKADADDRLGSNHPTVKPVDLMQWLVRLITPPPRLVCPRCVKLGYEKSTKTKSCDSSLRTLREGFQASGQSAPRAVLQQNVRERGYDAETEDLRDVRQDLSAEGDDAALLREGLCVPLDSETQEKSEAISDDQTWLSPDIQTRSSSSEGAERVHIRAPLDSGATDGSLADVKRGCSSSERDQVGQPRREPSVDAEGRPRQTQSSSPERADVSALQRENSDKPTCPHCRGLLVREGGLCLDPFAGTGTTGEAAWREGFKSILCEREQEYLDDITRRMGLCGASTRERKNAGTKARGKAASAGPLFDGGDHDPTRVRSSVLPAHAPNPHYGDRVHLPGALPGGGPAPSLDASRDRPEAEKTTR